VRQDKGNEVYNGVNNLWDGKKINFTSHIFCSPPRFPHHNDGTSQFYVAGPGDKLSELPINGIKAPIYLSEGENCNPNVRQR